MAKKKITASALLASLTALAGLIGVSGWCCTITGAVILSFFGISFLSSFFVYNSGWLFLASFVFTVLAIYYYIKYKSNRACDRKKL